MKFPFAAAPPRAGESGRWPGAAELEAAVQGRYVRLLMAFAILIPGGFAVGYLWAGMHTDAAPSGLLCLIGIGCALWQRRSERSHGPVRVLAAALVAVLAWRTLQQGAPLAGSAWWLSVMPFILAGAGLHLAAVGSVAVFVGIVTWLFFGGAGLAQVPTLGGVGPLRQYIAVVGSEGLALVMIVIAMQGRREVAAAIDATRAAAMEADAIKSRFLANMGHEIRTPLNGIIGAAELMRSRQLDDPQRAQLGGLMEQSARTLLTLLNDVLDWTKLEAGKVRLEARPLNLRQLVFQANELFAIQAYNKGIELTSSCNPDVPRQFVGDATRVRQIVDNLVGNAVKFTSRGGVHIHLSVERPGPGDPAAQRTSVRIEVADSGIGIDPARLPLLFKAFTQADESVTRRYGGTGLGLAICQELARLMGGRIDVASTPGQGSTFALVVPMESSDRRLPPRLGSLRSDVVLASASPGVQRHLKTILHDLGIEPRVVSQLGGAAGQHGGRVVLVDAPLLVSLPDAAGWLRRQAEAGRRVVVVTPLGSDLAIGLPEDVLLLYKPVRRRSLKAVLDALERPVDGTATAREFAPSPPPAGPHVLVAEDNAVNQIVVRAMLTELGATCVVASNGREALACLAGERFDLVLMDMQMPELDGLAATRALRADEAARAAPRIPIVAMTANAPDEDLRACREAGMDDFMAKPFGIAALRDVLARCRAASHAD